MSSEWVRCPVCGGCFLAPVAAWDEGGAVECPHPSCHATIPVARLVWQLLHCKSERCSGLPHACCVAPQVAA